MIERLAAGELAQVVRSRRELADVIRLIHSQVPDRPLLAMSGIRLEPGEVRQAW